MQSLVKQKRKYYYLNGVIDVRHVKLKFIKCLEHFVGKYTKLDDDENMPILFI